MKVSFTNSSLLCFSMLTLTLTLLSMSTTLAFGPTHWKIITNQKSFWRIHNDVNPFLEGDDDGTSDINSNSDIFDLDLARKRLQSMFQKDTPTNISSLGSDTEHRDTFQIQKFIKEAAKQSKKDGKVGTPTAPEDSLLPPLPPLSTIERDRRQVEIKLLEQLASGESMKELWELWYSERGGQALARLQQADQLMGDPTSWKDCETSLLQLIEEYSIYFVEPVNRLATLFYLQGKYEESYQLCRLILLKLKPWHVGALAGMVQVCVNRGDREEARYWASRRLPSIVAGSSFPPFETSNGPLNPRRAEWVQEMVLAAREMLKKAELSTQQQFGEPEDYYAKKMVKDSEDSAEDKLEGDVWQ